MILCIAGRSTMRSVAVIAFTCAAFEQRSAHYVTVVDLPADGEKYIHCACTLSNEK